MITSSLPFSKRALFTSFPASSNDCSNCQTASCWRALATFKLSHVRPLIKQWSSKRSYSQWQPFAWINGYTVTVVRPTKCSWKCQTWIKGRTGGIGCIKSFCKYCFRLSYIDLVDIYQVLRPLMKILCYTTYYVINNAYFCVVKHKNNYENEIYY